MTRRSGFTLLEVLVSVAILATVSVTVALVLGTGTESWRAASRLAETGHDGEAVLEQLMLALRSACYATDGELSFDYGFRHEDGGEGAAAQDAAFWTKIGNALVGEDVPWAGSPHRVKIYVDDDGEDGPGLYAAAWQLVGQPEDFDPEEDPVPVLLSDIVTGLDIRMLDPEKAVEPGEPYEWTDEWESSNRIPQRVMVTLALQPSEKGGEAQLLVRTTDIPLAELSWAPADFNSGDDSKGRDGKDGGGTGGGGPAAGNATPGTGAPAPSRQRQTTGSPSRIRQTTGGRGAPASSTGQGVGGGGGNGGGGGSPGGLRITGGGFRGDR